MANIRVLGIHGTFDGDANWVNESSNFARWLREALPDHTVEFIPIRWSAKNSFAARKRAAHEFSKELNSLPGGKKWENYVVAHSHGGYAPLYSMEKESVANLIAGVILFGTPIFDVRVREIRAAYSIYLIGAILILIYALLYLFENVSGDTANIFGVFALSSIFVAMWVLGDRSDRIVDRIRDKAQSKVNELAILPEHQRSEDQANFVFSINEQMAGTRFWEPPDRLAHQYRDRPFALPPILLLTAHGDEATFWLKILSIAGEGAYEVWNQFASRVAPWILLYVSCVFYLLFFVGILPNGSFADMSFNLVAIDERFFNALTNVKTYLAAVFFMIIAAIVGAGLLLLALPMAMLARGHKWGTGMEPLIQNLLVSVRLSRRPLEKLAKFQHVRYNAGADFLVKRLLNRNLSHSVFYQNRLIAEYVASWVLRHKIKRPLMFRVMWPQ